MTPKSQVFWVAFAFAAAMGIAATAEASTLNISNSDQTPAEPADVRAVHNFAQPETVKGAKAPSTLTSKNSTSVTLPNSTSNYLGDRVSWPNAIEAKASLDGDVKDGYCIPAYAKVIGATPAMDTSVKTGTSAGAQQYQAVTLDVPRKFWRAVNVFSDYSYIQDPPSPASSAPPAGATPNTDADSSKSQNVELASAKRPVAAVELQMCPDVTNAQTFYDGATAYVSDNDMKNAEFRSGFEYGALIVPFKMQLSGGKAFTGSSSVGGYLGYQNPIGDLGINYSPIAFAGASNISTSETTGSATKSQTVAGISYGGGILFDVKDSFHVGFVLGFDHVSSAQKYQYNDKPWISFEIGYSFAN